MAFSFVTKASLLPLTVAGLEGAGRGGEVGGLGVAGDVGVAGAVHRDAIAESCRIAAQVGAVDKGRAGGVQLRHEGVCRR